MTTDHELFDSMRSVNEFLNDLMDPKKTPGMPKAIRLRAYAIGRHYPSNSLIGLFELYRKEARDGRGRK